MDKIKQYFALMNFNAKLDLAWLLRDTKYALLNILTDAITSIAAVTGIFLLATRFNGVGGMDRYEVLFMLGYITMAGGIFEMFFSMNNVGHVSRIIGRGQIEHMFVQPISLPMQMLTYGFIPYTGNASLISGICITVIALVQLNFEITFLWLVMLILSLYVSVFILLLLSYFVSTLAFYAPVAGEEISSVVIDELGGLRQYPLSGMPKGVTLPLISILPYGLMGWFPSMVMLGKSPFDLGYMYPLIIAGILFIITYLVFKKGFKHYVSTGANRYSAMGHRR